MVRSARLTLLLCLAVLCFSLTKPASADTYSDYVAATSSGSAANIGFTGDGRSLAIVLNSGCALGGTVYTSPCYETFTPPSTKTITTTIPVLTDGDGPGGYSVYTALYTNGQDNGESLYVSHDGVTTLLYQSHWGLGDLRLNSFGDVAFVAYTTFNGILGDSNVLAVNQSSPAPTPEPSAILLLGTGILAMLAILRWKGPRVAPCLT